MENDERQALNYILEAFPVAFLVQTLKSVNDRGKDAFQSNPLLSSSFFISSSPFGQYKFPDQWTVGKRTMK